MTRAFHAYVGCRTTRTRNARGDGLNVYRVDAATGDWTHVQLVPDLVNPSFLCLDRTGRFLFTVHGDSEEVSALRIEDGSGRLTFVNRRSTGGRNPVHLALDPTNAWMVVANHVTSTLAVLPVNGETGEIGERSDLVTLSGTIGPHRVEQPFAKPHQAAFDPAGCFVVVPDKGLDRVFAFRLDATAGRLLPAELPSVAAREGSGPRHVTFHPSAPFAYVVNELDSTVTAYRIDDRSGALRPFQILSALPDNFTGNSRAAGIAVSTDGRFVWASNRGHDSIAAFAVDGATGRLGTTGWAPSGGRTPRFFAPDPTGRFLLVANEDGDTIVRLDVDRDTGLPIRPREVARTGSPVCIVFRPAP